MLVAGHGYNDPGAVGNGTNERDFIRKYITPNIAKYLRHAGHEVVYMVAQVNHKICIKILLTVLM